MKAFIEEYGQFIVSIIVGAMLFAMLYAGTVENTALMNRLVPDERNMALGYLKNTETMDESKIPKMQIVDSIAIMINKGMPTPVDWMSSSIVVKITDGQGHNLRTTEPNYVSMKDARDPDALVKGRINIIGTDAVNTQVKGDYKVTYQYENPETGYKNVHDLVVCVRRPYIPHEYIKSTGNQYIDTGIVPRSKATSIIVSYQPDTVSGRQDVILTTGSRMKFGIFISNGKWGYSYGDKEVVTDITATTSRQEIKLDSYKGEFSVGGSTVKLDDIDSVGDGWIQIFKSGQKSGKLYSVDIYENDKLRRSFFPAYIKTQNKMGLWDSADWVGYSNSSGVDYPPFEYGNEIDE